MPRPFPPFGTTFICSAIAVTWHYGDRALFVFTGSVVTLPFYLTDPVRDAYTTYLVDAFFCCCAAYGICIRYFCCFGPRTYRPHLIHTLFVLLPCGLFITGHAILYSPFTTTYHNLPHTIQGILLLIDLFVLTHRPLPTLPSVSANLPRAFVLITLPCGL